MEYSAVTLGRALVLALTISLAMIGWILMYRSLAHRGALVGGVGASAVCVMFLTGLIWLQYTVEFISPDQVRSLAYPSQHTLVSKAEI